MAPLVQVIRGSETPWLVSRLRQGHAVRLSRLGDLPTEAAVDRQTFNRLGTRSIVLAPLVVGGSVAGALAAATLRAERQWPDELVVRLRLLADVFAHALARQRAERAAQESAEQIRSLAGRLMTAQEEERRRIARELHDDVNQQLAALSIALSVLGRRLPTAPAGDWRDDVARLQTRTAQLAEAIRHLSHELHPGVLEQVGLVAALRGHCRGFEREHGLTVSSGPTTRSASCRTTSRCASIAWRRKRC